MVDGSDEVDTSVGAVRRFHLSAKCGWCHWCSLVWCPMSLAAFPQTFIDYAVFKDFLPATIFSMTFDTWSSPWNSQPASIRTSSSSWSLWVIGRLISFLFIFLTLFDFIGRLISFLVFLTLFGFKLRPEWLLCNGLSRRPPHWPPQQDTLLYKLLLTSEIFNRSIFAISSAVWLLSLVYSMGKPGGILLWLKALPLCSIALRPRWFSSEPPLQPALFFIVLAAYKPFKDLTALK